MQVELVQDARADLGEGPAWDWRLGRLTWVDIREGVLHIYQPEDDSRAQVKLGEMVGCAAPGSDGDLLLGLQSGIARLHLDSGQLTPLACPEPHLPGNRFNDGKCDPAGRFVAGTMDSAETATSGSLYSYSPDGVLIKLLTDLRISNGLAWSPDERTFYFIDTPTRQVTAFDYERASGEIGNPRPVITVPPGLGWPDGMCSDSEGMLWVAMWGGARLTRWDPASGKILAIYPVPALHVSACAFGGKDLGDLYITSARKGMSAEQLRTHPLSGGLFRMRAGVQGLPITYFGG